MRLNKTLIKSISTNLEKGMYAKSAARSEGISERIYYRWKEEGDALIKSVLNDDLEIDEKEFNKLTDTQKLKIQFCQSIDLSTAKGEIALVDIIYKAAKKDWKAALQILQRRHPKLWANKDYLHVDQEVTNKPSKLKEIEDKYFKDVPESKMKELTKGMQELIKNASNGTGEHTPGAKG